MEKLNRHDSPAMHQEPTKLIVRMQLGVWTVTMLREGHHFCDIRQHIAAFYSTIPLGVRLATEMFSLEPVLLVLFFLAKIWGGIQSALLLYLTSRLLKVVEVGLQEGSIDLTAVSYAVATRLVALVVAAIIKWWSENSLPALRGRVKCHFQMFLMRASLRIDLPTSQEPQGKMKVTPENAWRAFSGIVDFAVDLIGTGSQIALIFESCLSSGDWIFTAVIFAKPLFCMLRNKTLWSKAHAVHTSNVHYQRMEALKVMATPEYRADVIGINVGDYILKEYGAASSKLNGASDDWAEEQYDLRRTPFFQIAKSTLGDMPMIYCAFAAVLYPTRFKLSSIAILQQSSQTLQWSLESAIMSGQSFHRRLVDIRNLYRAESVVNKMASGTEPYPNRDSETNSGMALDVRNVDFSYPGTFPSIALKGVSLSIKPGQLVVFVGENGSGKSTIIKLLTRMYDATAGEILVDGRPASVYRQSDLHDAMATLTQDHRLFPLSVAENIGVGDVKNLGNAEMVNAAAEQGGALACINKLEHGADTILDRPIFSYIVNTSDDPEDPLQQELEKARKTKEVSGGERQRLVAARTFMRINSDKIKLIAVDEPSSALDPNAEAKLFENLRAAQKGRTMVFVTHRFGHLTKYADQIICMKDGTVAESGTHDELMADIGSQYRKMYETQAQAFDGI